MGIPGVPVAKTTQLRVTLGWPRLGSRTKLTGPRAVAGSSTWRWHSSVGRHQASLGEGARLATSLCPHVLMSRPSAGLAGGLLVFSPVCLFLVLTAGWPPQCVCVWRGWRGEGGGEGGLSVNEKKSKSNTSRRSRAVGRGRVKSVSESVTLASRPLGDAPGVWLVWASSVAVGPPGPPPPASLPHSFSQTNRFLCSLEQPSRRSSCENTHMAAACTAVACFLGSCLGPALPRENM